MNELATGIFIAILVITCIENILNLLPESLPHGTGGSVVTARSTCAHDGIGRDILNFKLNEGEKINFMNPTSLLGGSSLSDAERGPTKEH